MVNEEGKNHSFWVKDLSRLSRFIDDLIIIDNSPAAYIYQKENGMPIHSWTGEDNDFELYLYLNMFKMIAKFEIDLKYVLLNVVKDDLTVDHNKFAEIVNSSINKVDFAKKTKEYRKAHELSKSPNKINIHHNPDSGDGIRLQTCQIQTDYFHMDETDSDSSDEIDFDSIDINLQPQSRCKSNVLNKFENSSEIKNLSTNRLCDHFVQRRKRKKMQSIKVPKIMLSKLN
jgi:hypothetical protein